MNNNTLELEIKTTANDAKKSLESLVTPLKNIESVLTNIYLELGSIEKEGKQSVNNTANSVNKLDKNSKSATKSASKLTKAFSFAGSVYAIKKLTSSIIGMLTLSTDYSEQMNLFNVTFKNMKKEGIQTYSELGRAALKYQNKLNENFGTSMTETLKYQSLFQTMGESAGIKDQYASVMSETMTNLTYDLASLFNKNETDVAEALRAGVYAGQTKPLRQYGIDVTQTTMKPLLESLGITDRSVSELNQGEKQILRYIAALKQAQNAMGDYANTIESPTNQMKVFNNLLVEAKVHFTNLFVGTFAKILPYANAILMVIKEVSKAIANLFGIKISDYNTGQASADVSDYIEDIGDNASGAAGKVKELKREILGFDEVHNINEDTGTSGGSGNAGGVSGGIDQRLLDSIKSYNNGLDQAKMKATEIRDKIMEWLGFTKYINSETGEVYFKFTNTDSTLYRVVTAIKDIIKYGTDVIKKVLQKIKDDFDNGVFGTFIATIFETIANALKSISQNEFAVNVIAKVVEALLLIKGLSFVAQLTGITKLINAISRIGTTTAAATGTAMASLGTLGLALAAVAAVWTITLILKGADAINDTLVSLKNNADTASKASSDLAKNLLNAANQADWEAKTFDNLSGAILGEINANTKDIESLEKKAIKTKQTIATINANRTANENLKKAVEALYKNNKITTEQYNDFNSKLSTYDYETKKAEEKTAKYREELKKMQDSANQSKTKVGELSDKMKSIQSKAITIDVDANTNKFSNKLKETINNIFGFGALGGGGTRATGGIYSNGSWHNIQQYANGGLPQHGTIFAAGERGAEIVGNINGRTEVLNQSQIASAIYSAVVSAMSNSGSQTIELVAHTDEGVVIDRINQKTRQTGVCPINIV